MDSLLKGTKVVEFTAVIQGPMAGLILSQLGADVIRIEDRKGRDRVRFNLPGEKGPIQIADYTNRNKKSITLDLSKEKGQEIAHKLVANSDVFLSNYLPKSLARMGFDYATLVKFNEKLVYATSSSYGKHGPDCNKAAFDPMARARSGIMMAAGQPGDPPVEMPGFVADCLAGTFLAFGAISGLLAKEKLGIGQEISTSLLGPQIWSQFVNITQYLTDGGLNEDSMERIARKDAPNPLWSNYKCKDGKWIKLTISKVDPIWHDFCHLLDIEGIEDDGRFENSSQRQDYNEDLIKILDDTFARKTRDEWMEHLKDQNPGILYEAVMEVGEVPHDPQVIANNYIVENEHPTRGHIRMLQLPIEFSKTPVLSGGKPAPYLGENTEEILLGLGYNSEEIIQLQKDNVI